MELTLLDRLKNKEDIFQIVKPVNKVTLDSNLLSSPNRTESDDERSSKDVREVKDVKVVIPVSSESTPRAKKVKSCSSEEQIQKPKPIRPVNGGSIIINNFYNILYQPKDSVVKEGSDEAVIKNIIMNIKTKDDPSELGEQNKSKEFHHL